MLTSAVQRIPPEILCKIFRECLPLRTDPDLGVFKHEPDTIVAPLRISRVCHAWRSVALSYRFLWSNLVIDYELSHRPRQRKMTAEIFHTWLERSNRAPLNFVFYCHAVDTSHEGYPVAESMMRRLINEQSRWQDVYFIWTISNQLKSCVNLDNMPLLTHLKLVFEMRGDDLDAHNQSALLEGEGEEQEQEEGGEDDDDDDDNLDFDNYEEDGVPPDLLINFSRSPLLKYVELMGNYDFAKNGGVLGDLEVCDFYFDKWWLHRTRRTLETTLNFLGSAPNLKSLNISVYGDGDRVGSVGGEPLVLLNLQYLHLEQNIAGSFFVDSIVLPSLRNLVYVLKEHEDTLYSLILRSKPPLTHLAVSGHGIRMTEDSIIPVLHELPLLQELWISFAVVSSDLFRELTVISHDSDTGGSGTNSECRDANTIDRPGEHVQTSDHTLEKVHDPSSTVAAKFSVCPSLRRLRLGYLKFSQDAAVVLSALRDMVKSRVVELRTLRRVFCYKDTVNYMTLDYERIPELQHIVDESGVLNLHIMILSEGQDSDPDEVFR